MAADVLAQAEQLAGRVEEAGRVQAAGRGEGRLRLAETVRERREQVRRDPRRSLSTFGASTETASSAPLPQTPQEELV